MSTPAGWYPDQRAAGGERYWDGAQWTDQRRPMAQFAGPRHDNQDPPPQPSGWSSRRFAWVGLCLYVVAAIAVPTMDKVDPDVRASIAGMLIGVATVFILIAVIATGVRIGRHEHRREGEGGRQ